MIREGCETSRTIDGAAARVIVGESGKEENTRKQEGKTAIAFTDQLQGQQGFYRLGGRDKYMTRWVNQRRKVSRE